MKLKELTKEMFDKYTFCNNDFKKIFLTQEQYDKGLESDYTTLDKHNKEKALLINEFGGSKTGLGGKVNGVWKGFTNISIMRDTPDSYWVKVYGKSEWDINVDSYEKAMSELWDIAAKEREQHD